LLYPIIFWLLNKFNRQKPILHIVDSEQSPTITVICAAYNEQEHIKQKIESFLELNYPKDKINMIIISDDSTDKTNEIVNSYTNHNVKLVIQKPRGGKQRAHNLIEPTLISDYILSTDANSIFEPNSVRELVKAISVIQNIGLVSGVLKLVKAGTRDSGEGLYWKFDSFLKLLDSDFYSIIGANGSNFLIKRELFTQIDPASVDDFERTLYVLSKGYKAKYVPTSMVYEEVTGYASEEFARKVRIITQEWFALRRNIGLMNPFKFTKVSIILISHKVIRWLLFVFTIMMLISSFFLSPPFYKLIFVAQVLFYLFGTIELIYQKKGKNIPMGNLPAYFLTMNAASLIAFIRFIQNRDVSVWNPIRKQETQ
jgi:cellulose synthase/poly-beta-1,6-N-acetylglucosamine synthase-like glycosyltransferase